MSELASQIGRPWRNYPNVFAGSIFKTTVLIYFSRQSANLQQLNLCFTTICNFTEQCHKKLTSYFLFPVWFYFYFYLNIERSLLVKAMIWCITRSKQTKEASQWPSGPGLRLQWLHLSQNKMNAGRKIKFGSLKTETREIFDVINIKMQEAIILNVIWKKYD